VAPSASPNLSSSELDQVHRAESAGRPVVVFVHGLWLLADSWEPWRQRFEARGYSTIAPQWPADPPTVALARAEPGAMGTNSLGRITAHYADVIAALSAKPVVVGHSFGGLITQQLAGRGLAAASVAISPAPARGILNVPPSSLRASWPVVRNPANRRRAVMLSYKQFRYAFANAVGDEEARRLYETYAVPGAGRLVFQAAFANLNPRSDARVDTANPDRGPMKIISGREDRIVPWSVARAAFKRQRRNPSHTEFFEVLGHGHSLVIDSGWEDVADSTLRFVHRTLAHR
jgi:pimeloyl-ACP methyl ester carboxylesterase